MHSTVSLHKLNTKFSGFFSFY